MALPWSNIREQRKDRQVGALLGSGAQTPMLPDPEWVPAWCYRDAQFGPPRHRGGPLPPSPPEAETRAHSYGEAVATGFIHCLSPAAMA